MNISQLEPADQRTKDWRVARLGCFTGSEVSKLLKSSRTKGEVFGDTAKTYIYTKMAERDLSSQTIGNETLWQEYLNQTSITNRAMQFGIDNEGDARRAFERATGLKVVETSSIAHPEIPNFAASPDGVIADADGLITACVEIKCPSPSTFMQYRCEVKDGESLRRVNDTYYYQCQAEMMVTGADVTYFVAYNPFLIHDIHIARIPRCDESCQLIRERILLAEEFIKSCKND